MSALHVEFLSHVPSPQGPQADLLVVERNGNKHQVRCLLKIDGPTEIGFDDGAVHSYLADRYGVDYVWGLCEQATLSGNS